jgi:hypothetical protein
MLPAPFFAEVPADLGDDETWAAQATGAPHGATLVRRLGRWLRPIVDEAFRSAALALARRVRRLLAA